MESRATFAVPPPPLLEGELDATTTASALPKRRPGGIFRRAGWALVDYFRRVAGDYASAGRDLMVECRARPVKTVCVSSLIVAAYLAYRTNPDERLFLHRLTEWRQVMALTPEAIHSSTADSYLHLLTDLYNDQRIRYINCWLFSLVLRKPHNPNCKLYSTQDVNLKERWWRDLEKNTLDIGAFNRFWTLERAFVDYDVREEEFIEPATTAIAAKQGSVGTEY